MPDTDTIAKAIDAMVKINAAIRNIRLYPPGSAMVDISIQRVFPSLETIMETESSVSFAESEKTLLVFDQPLGEKDQQKPQVASFIETLLDFGIKNITFTKGIGAEELRVFLDLLSRKPEDVEADGGLHQLMPPESVPHILLDHKVYVAIKKDERVVSEDDVDGIGSRQLLEKAGVAEKMGEEEFSQLARDPDRLAAIVKRGISHITNTDPSAPPEEQSARLSDIIRGLDGQADDGEKIMVSKEIAANLISMDPDTLAHVLSSEIEGKIGDDILEQVAHLLDDEKFGQVAAKLKYAGLLGFMSRTPAADAGEDAADTGTAAAFAKLLESDKGQRLKGDIETYAREVKQDHSAHYKSNINRLIKGNIDSLSDPAIMRALAGTIDQLMAKDKMKTADTLLARLSSGLDSDLADTRTGAARVLAEYAGRSIVENGAVDAGATTQLVRWLTSETSATPATGEVFEEIRGMVTLMLRSGQFASANAFLEPIHQIATGAMPREEAIAASCVGIIESLVASATFGALLDRTRESDEPPDAQIEKTVGFLTGKTAVSSADGDRKAAARRLQAATDSAGADEVAQRLASEKDIDQQRELVILLGKIGDQAHLPTLEAMLPDADGPLIRDVLKAVYTIGGPAGGDLLLAQLDTSPVTRKATLIAMLGMLKHAPATPRLIQFLAPDVSLPVDAKAAIQEKVCLALGKMGAAGAAPALESIVGDDGKSGSYTDAVVIAARKAVAAIRKAPAAPKKASAAPAKPPAKKSAAPAASKGKDPDEAAAMALAAGGDTEAAVKKLFELIVTSARKKNFARADALRERMMEVDGMALTEIVKSAEIIEEEKSAALDSDHEEVWGPLYALLDGEEINALFYTTEQVTFEPGQVMLSQGHINDRLYFISQGRAQSVYRDGDKESALKTYRKGSVAGIHSFFNISVCKSSVIALSSVTANALPRSALAEWKDSHAALETKLAEHFLAAENEDALWEEAGNRRRHPRVDVQGKMLVQLANNAGKAVGKPFKGDLSDLSLGGLSFFIKASNRETARTMLGRRLNMTFAIPGPSGRLKTTHAGRVRAVNYHLQNDYSVHVQFATLLSGRAAEAVNQLAGD